MAVIFGGAVALPAGVTVTGAEAQELTAPGSAFPIFIFTIPSGYWALVTAAWCRVQRGGGAAVTPNEAQAEYGDGNGATMHVAAAGMASSVVGGQVQFSWSLNAAGVQLADIFGGGSLPPLLIPPGGTFAVDVVQVPAGSSFVNNPRAFATMFPYGRSGASRLAPSLLPTPRIR